MAASLFERTLSTAAMDAAFGDAALVGAMLEFEAALAASLAEEGAIPAAAAAAIEAACRVERFDLEAMVVEARSAGSLAIPLVRMLTAQVAAADPAAAPFVHRGSTSQDVIDTAMVLATRRALVPIDADLLRLCDALAVLARAHAATPQLARTLLQPAEVTSFGFKVAGWRAPLLRARVRLAGAAEAALQLQFGGAVGTLAAYGARGPAIARRLGARLALSVPPVAWHVQRDAWAGLGCELALLCGSLGKIGRDLALLAQGEVGEVAEPHAPGRGGSTAMPHKRNPVAALVAIAAATRAPHQAATLLAAMAQEHERGLGSWQAELAGWPGLLGSAHGAVLALADACAGLEVDPARMRANIDAHHARLGPTAAPPDIDGAARHAGMLALAALDAAPPPPGSSP